jgi:hypothetical protein
LSNRIEISFLRMLAIRKLSAGSGMPDPDFVSSHAGGAQELARLVLRHRSPLPFALVFALFYDIAEPEGVAAGRRLSRDHWCVLPSARYQTAATASDSPRATAESWPGYFIQPSLNASP